MHVPKIAIVGRRTYPGCPAMSKGPDRSEAVPFLGEVRMKQNDQFRSFPFLPFIVAATVLTLVGALGPAGVAAAAPEGQTVLDRPDCILCIVGTPSVKWSGGSGSFHVDRVENRTPHGSMSLSLQVQLQATYPDPWREGGLDAYELSAPVRLDPLPAHGFRSNIDSGTIAFDGSKVPAGEYWMLVMLLDDSRYIHWDYAVMKDKVRCDGSTCVDPGPCKDMSGEWGYTWTGIFVLPTGATPAAASGTFAIDATGQVSGTQTSSVGGLVARDTLKGNVALKGDCTGTLSVGLYDDAGTLLRTAAWGLVLDDDGQEVRGIFQSLALANGVSVQTIAIANGRRLVPKQDAERWPDFPARLSSPEGGRRETAQ